MDLVPAETKEPDPIVTYSGIEPYLTDHAKVARRLRVETKVPKKQKLLSAVDDTFELIGGGPRLAMWADENYGEFVKLYGKTLPSQIQATIEGKLQHIIRPALPPSPLDAIEGEFSEPNQTAAD